MRNFRVRHGIIEYVNQKQTKKYKFVDHDDGVMDGRTRWRPSSHTPPSCDNQSQCYRMCSYILNFGSTNGNGSSHAAWSLQKKQRSKKTLSLKIHGLVVTMQHVKRQRCRRRRSGKGKGGKMENDEGERHDSRGLGLTRSVPIFACHGRACLCRSCGSRG